MQVYEYTKQYNDCKYSVMIIVYVCANVNMYEMTWMTQQWDEHRIDGTMQHKFWTQHDGYQLAIHTLTD